MQFTTKALSILVLIAAVAACGDDSNNSTNGATNNTTANNTTANNTTANNTTANNTTANNTTANNTTANNTTPGQICSYTEDDTDGDGMPNTTVLSFYENDDWEHTVSEVVTQMGSPFQSNTYKIDLEWDENGNLTHQRVDFDNDGTREWHITLTFDENGNQTRFEFDNDYDGDAEFIETVEYDEFGQNTRITRDGVFNPANWQVTEEANGRLNMVFDISWYGEGEPLHIEYDADNDGELEQETLFTYDANGNVLTIEQDGAFGSNDLADLRVEADGTVDVRVEFTYDTDGNMLTERQDGFWIPDTDEAMGSLESADGTWDFERLDIVTDDDGNHVEWRQDGRRNVFGEYSMRADGTFDRFQNVTYAEYSAGSGEFYIAMMEFDEGDDGTVDLDVAQTFNEDRALIYRAMDGVIDNGNNLLTPANGTFQDIADITWFGVGQPESYERDFDGDGNLDVDVEWLYTNDGKLVSMERDGQMSWQEFEYGPDGPADGVLDERVTNTYDEQGRATHHLREVNDNGTLVTAAEWTQQWGSCDELSQ